MGALALWSLHGGSTPVVILMGPFCYVWDGRAKASAGMKECLSLFHLQRKHEVHEVFESGLFAEIDHVRCSLEALLSLERAFLSAWVLPSR